MKDRLKEIIDYYNLNTHQFEVKINASESTIRKVIIGKNSMSTDTLRKISDTFPEISIDWLVTGEGQMLKTKTTSTQNNDNLAALIASFQATLAEKDKQIDRLLNIIDRLSSSPAMPATTSDQSAQLDQLDQLDQSDQPAPSAPSPKKPKKNGSS